MALDPTDLQNLAGQLVIHEVREHLRELDLDDLIDENLDWLNDQALNFGRKDFTDDDLDMIADVADLAQVFVEVNFNDPEGD